MSEYSKELTTRYGVKMSKDEAASILLSIMDGTYSTPLIDGVYNPKPMFSKKQLTALAMGFDSLQNKSEEERRKKGNRMTLQKAVNTLTKKKLCFQIPDISDCPVHNCEECPYNISDGDFVDALDMAIDALDKIQNLKRCVSFTKEMIDKGAYALEDVADDIDYINQVLDGEQINE